MKEIIPIYPLTTARLRKIEKDWLSLLPGFGNRGKPARGKPGGLNKRVGPLLVRVSTARGGRGAIDYLPHFSVHNLASASDFLFVSLEQELPYPYKYIKDKEHEMVFKERVEMMKKIAPIPLLGPLTLDDIFKGYSQYVEKNKERTEGYFISQLESPALIAAWAGESEKAKGYLEWADNVFKTWKEETRSRFGGDQWRPNLERRISDPEKLRQITREEVIKHKCEKVPYQNIVGVKYQETT